MIYDLKPFTEDDARRADCARRETPCGIVGPHRHDDRYGTYPGVELRLGTRGFE